MRWILFTYWLRTLPARWKNWLSWKWEIVRRTGRFPTKRAEAIYIASVWKKSRAS